MAERTLRIGVAGLGRGFMLMLPTFLADRRVALVAAADPRDEARARFVAEFGGRAHETVEALCGDDSVDVVYVATPHEIHARHAIVAAEAGKHVLVEKPMALDLDECRAMIAAARGARVHLIVGPSHSFDAPVLRTRAMIASGAFGRLRLVTALNFTDFVYRPRRPEELDPEAGGGVVLSQAAHQVDIARLLAGGLARSVRAMTGDWDDTRPTEGAYAAFIDFGDGAAATLTYSGYDHFDSDEFVDWIGETGAGKERGRHGAARRRLRQVGTAAEEAALKATRGLGGSGVAAAQGQRNHEHFGLLLASCEHADLRPLTRGVMIYGDDEQRLDALPAPDVPRVAVIDELYGAVVHGRPPLHSGDWAMATLEVCLAIRRSARERREIALEHQVALPADAEDEA
ncbi:MAG: Gfo/Idh/MocA family protein [Candidatus Eiseniibacteriota bacterium]